jgi:hypothetical protein
MIHYLVTRAHAYTMRMYLETWQRDLAGRVSFEYYEDLPYRQHIAGGTYIFSDLERLNVAQLAAAQSYAEQLRQGGGKIFNEPRNVLRRYELLKLMHEKGVNGFNVYRLNEPRTAMRFPVFVREENEHTGSLTGLLQNDAELEKAIAELTVAGKDARHLLIVEYCHTADSGGIFRKYAAMKIGDRLIPRHVLFSGEWVDKYPDVIDMGKIGEELAFLKLNPHENELREAFALARIDYGRVDYSVLDGKLTIWEINTNPVIMAAPGKCDPDRLPGQARSAKGIAEAFDRIDSPTNGHVIDLKWDRKLMRELGIGAGEEFAAAVRQGLRRLPGLLLLRQKLRAL